jgi:holo-[acyl-carrier protein] synthase
MIIGTGTDVVSIPEVQRLKSRYGNKFLNKVFTPSEKKYCQRHRKESQHYAARFAAKEATAKALGVGFGRSLDWKDIVVYQDELGKPLVRFRNGVAKKIKNNGYKCHISLAHNKDMASAISILECCK